MTNGTTDYKCMCVCIGKSGGGGGINEMRGGQEKWSKGDVWEKNK